MKSPFLEAALQAADAADRIIRRKYRGSFQVRTKRDSSPVTEVDEAAERAIKRVLRKRFPEHGFYGEETGLDRGTRRRGGGRGTDRTEYLWLVDPIDGTKAFVRGYPIFSVQIALMRRATRPGTSRDELILGVSSAPCWNGGKGERVYAEKKRGAWLGRQRLRIAPAKDLKRATLSTGNLADLARSPAWARLGRVIPRLHRIRGYGDFLHYHYLADGRIDAVIESNVNILDIAALAVIVREAGGVFTDLSGQPVGLETRSVLAAGPALHKKLRAALRYRA